jgi:poly-gamma-glutamate synthesis protein (capsule biosynthesis protein)
MKKKKPDLLIVSFHWGIERTKNITKSQETLSRIAIDEGGADLVLGHHPHVLQEIEKYNSSYIFYSLGNFIFDRQVYPKTDETIILNANIDKKGIKNIDVFPVRIVNCQPEILEGKEAVPILEDLVKYSEGNGADIRITDENKAEIFK